MTFVSVRVTAQLPESVQVIGFHKILIDLFAMKSYKRSGFNSCECLFLGISLSVDVNSNVIMFHVTMKEVEDYPLTLLYVNTILHFAMLILLGNNFVCIQNISSILCFYVITNRCI